MKMHFSILMLTNYCITVWAINTKENIYKSIKGKRMLHDVIQSVNQTSSTECLLMCERNEHCSSINFNVPKDYCEILQPKVDETCKLLKSGEENNPNWMHYGNCVF